MNYNKHYCIPFKYKVNENGNCNGNGKNVIGFLLELRIKRYKQYITNHNLRELGMLFALYNT